jgi:Zn-finger nucleic acid-binding protein
MKCPVDDTVLVMSDRQGVEIDYCPQCRGVWLDRGELDKVLDRTAAGGSTGDTRAGDDDRRRDQPAPAKKKRSFLSEIFEFGE